MATFELWQSRRNGQWYWHLKSDANGQVICWAEGYTTKANALNSIAWVKANAKSASQKEL